MSKAKIEIASGVAMVLAIAGVMLNNHRLILCFPLWLASNAIVLCLHLRARLWILALKDFVFVLLAIEGWRLWA